MARMVNLGRMVKMDSVARMVRMDYLERMDILASMESEEMMSDLLGTMWWSVLCVIAGMVLGTYLRPWIMEKLGK